ncbi:hypothetical protein N8G13_00100 [Mycoplasma zalophi]|uniref:hypothetical protein n=1 Tax=Mycoplasma zalophi TaxID=191287 RepID=UPI0021CA0846|nr:hypothetical protein [Mycoplasma zalophi]MCU4116871.1 hypothetical protein [Mycoplasma zalophi]
MENKDTDISYENIHINPIKNFYEKNVHEIETYINKFIDLRYKQINNNVEANVNLKLKQIKMHREDIEKKAKSLSVKLKKFINFIIFVLFFVLIGFAFWKIFKKNKNVINEFNNFAANKNKVITQITNEKQKLLYQIFNSFSLNDVKKFVLSQMGIFKVNNNNFNEVLENINVSNPKVPIFFRSIEKYDIRNNFFYDLDFYNLTYSNILYTGSRLVRYVKDGKTYTKTVVANYQHPAPFLNQTHTTLYLTNYLPNLKFISTQPLTAQQVKKMTKRNELILENKEIYTRYNFKYNDELSFVNFFQLITQDRYIDWYDYATKNNIFNSEFEKTSNGFIVYNKKYEVYNKILKNNSDWFLKITHNKNSETLSIEDVQLEIKSYIKEYIRDTLASLTLIFSNKYLASETYNTNKQFSFDYIDKQNIQNHDTQTYNNLFFINKLNNNKYFSLKTKKPARDFIYEKFQRSILGNNVHFINLDQWSWYIEKKIKYVTVSDFNVGAVSVRVDYDDYIKFSENKTIIFSSNYKLKNSQFINSFVNKMEDSISVYDTEDKSLLYTVSTHKLYWNFQLNIDKELLNDSIEIIKNFNNLFKTYHNFYSLEIDSEGIYVFINEPNKIPKNITMEMVSFINNI